MERLSVAETTNTNTINPHEMANRLDNVHSAADFDRVYDDLARSTDMMNKSDTLNYLRQVAGFENKGVGADLTIDGDHLMLTSPYEKTDLILTDGKSSY